MQRARRTRYSKVFRIMAKKYPIIRVDPSMRDYLDNIVQKTGVSRVEASRRVMKALQERKKEMMFDFSFKF